MNSEREIQGYFARMTLTDLEELEKAISDIETEPRARRRKAERDRARRIEQRYRAEIRRCERERPYRRIYKPP